MVCSKALWRDRKNAFAYGEEDIIALGVRLLAAIAQANAFEQGNKRTAFAAMWQFLRLNGYDLNIEDSEFWAGPTVELIEHRLSEDDFGAALRAFVVERLA